MCSGDIIQALRYSTVSLGKLADLRFPFDFFDGSFFLSALTGHAALEVAVLVILVSLNEFDNKSKSKPSEFSSYFFLVK